MNSCEKFMFNSHTKVSFTGEAQIPVKKAVDILLRDMNKVFSIEDKVHPNEKTEIIIDLKKDVSENLPTESFLLKFEHKIMKIIAADELGIVYGVLYISKEYLGVDPLWFWNDKEPESKPYVEIPMLDYKSSPYRVKYRGWFVNDEVLLSGWKDRSDSEQVWSAVFETLLRCGGNMVIPGTDKNSRLNKKLASDMGLWITHHHAEPLGAEMFLRAYPKSEPVYDKNGELFEKLWRNAVMDQNNTKVIWNLGFRGQGDQAFWNYDSTYKTPEARGKLISKVIRRQYEIVKEFIDEPICCTNLYGEIMELYKEGFIEFPEGVIKIWADSGYGKMVSRRQENHNPRVYSLPDNSDIGPHGIYYHVSFYDLQASNHITMLPNTPEFVAQELKKAFEAKADEYLILNCGNIRPHAYMLNLISEIWKTGYVDVDQHMKEYMNRNFTSKSEAVEKCFRRYFAAPVQYGECEDERAGEQFYNFPVREIISHWIKERNDETLASLLWASGKISFHKQIEWYKKKCEEKLNEWQELKTQCVDVLSSLDGQEKILFSDSLMLQVTIHLTGCKGAQKVCLAYEAYERKNYALAFVLVSEAMEQYKVSLAEMKAAEHDKWKNFYRNDCLTNIKLTVYCLDSLRRFLRILGDGPNFYVWEKEYVLSEEDRQIMLITNMTNQLEDEELYLKIRDKFKME